MTQSTESRQEILDGLRDATPVMLAVCFFGMLFGTTAVNNGLTLGQAMLSSTLVFAGASQLVFLELYSLKVPVWSILLAVFAINFRHVLYSASIGRYMGRFSIFQRYSAFFLLCDPLFGAGELRASKRPLTPAYYFGYGLLLYGIWLLFTLVGGLFGALITDPKALGLDMLLSLYFLTLLMGFRSRPNWLVSVLASGVVSVLVYRHVGSPWHIMSGGLAGILLAAFIGKPDAEKPDDDPDLELARE